MNLSDVTILITSFMRPAHLGACLRSIRETLPECKVIVVDDSGLPCDIALPFDSGLPAKRNAGVKACQTKYLLMGSDDFDFTREARSGILRLLMTLENNLYLDVAGGRVGNRPYEGFMNVVAGEHIAESRLHADGSAPFYPVDLTVNYFLARTESIRSIPWDERMKIGGEHGDWFLTLKDLGKRVCWVPGVNIEEIQGNADPLYAKYRGRARELGHRIFLEKRNVKRYYGFDEPAPAAAIRPRSLIMVMSCHSKPDRLAEIRATWAKSCPGSYKIFLGRCDSRMPAPDEVFLDVDDDYRSLPLKVQKACAWALEHGFGPAFKLDDDCYLVPDRLFANIPAHDYVGRVNASAKGHYLSGGCGYWLSTRAMELVCAATADDWAEDRFVGKVLRDAGIAPRNDPRYTLYPWPGESLDDFISACLIFENLPAGSVKPLSMSDLHRSFESAGTLPTAHVSRSALTTREPLVSCLMPTADRRQFIARSLRCFESQTYKNLELVILDDGSDAIADLVPKGDKRIRYYRIRDRHLHGWKMNKCAELARGELLIVWDDDAVYAPDRVARQAWPLLDDDRLLLTGTSALYYFDRCKNAWLYESKNAEWLGAVAFRKSTWRRVRWENIGAGADTKFVRTLGPQRCKDLQDPRLSLEEAHSANASARPALHPQVFKSVPWYVVDDLARKWGHALLPSDAVTS